MKQNKRVLHFLKTGNYSGAEYVAITIINEMNKKYGYEGIYASLSGKIDVVLEKNKVKHAIVKKNTVKEYQKIVDFYNPDIIHAHDFWTSVLVAKVSSNALRISHLHHNALWLKKVNIKTLVYLVASKKYDYILGVSNSVIKQYIFYNQVKCKAFVIGNPVHSCRIIEMASIANEWVDSDVIFLGRLDDSKNPIRFLRIISLCKKVYPQIKALMVGDGKLLSKCKQEIHKLDLTDNVKMIGFKQNPYGYLKHAKIMCIPSVWEGFGLVVTEAFALGIPVVASPVGGIKDLVTEESGLLCNLDNEFMDEIIQLLANENYYKSKSNAALKRSLELDNMDYYFNKVNEIYLDTLKEKF